MAHLYDTMQNGSLSVATITAVLFLSCLYLGLLGLIVYIIISIAKAA